MQPPSRAARAARILEEIGLVASPTAIGRAPSTTTGTIVESHSIVSVASGVTRGARPASDHRMRALSVRPCFANASTSMVASTRGRGRPTCPPLKNDSQTVTNAPRRCCARDGAPSASGSTGGSAAASSASMIVAADSASASP